MEKMQKYETLFVVDVTLGEDAVKALVEKYINRITENGEIIYRLTPEKEIVPGSPCLVNCEFESESGETFRLVDYASAGRDWESTIAAWLPTK